MAVYKIAELPRRLNDIMDFDHVIRVNADGTIDTDPKGTPYAPESIVFTRHDGSVMADNEAAWAESVRSQGWEPERGWTGQYGYRGSFMHESEYVGGSLADHILATPGLWTVVVVTALRGDPDDAGEDFNSATHACDDCADAPDPEVEDEDAGWAILHMDDGPDTDSYVVTIDPRPIRDQRSHIRSLPKMDLTAARALVTQRWIGGHFALGRIVRVTDMAEMSNADDRIAELEAEQTAAMADGTIDAWERAGNGEELDTLREARGFAP
jgi:hypothetical protein